MVAECGTKRAMNRRGTKRALRPLDDARLNAARAALRRPIRDHPLEARRLSRAQAARAGLGGAATPDPAAIADRLAGLGYVDDRAFALRGRGALGARARQAAARPGAACGRGRASDDGADALRLAAAEALEFGASLCPAAPARAVRRTSRGRSARARARRSRRWSAPGHQFDACAAIIGLAPRTRSVDDARNCASACRSARLKSVCRHRNTCYGG